MQNPHFGSKIKIAKNMSKSSSANHLQFFCAKNRSKKHLNIREMRAFLKSAIMHLMAIAHAKSSLWLKN